MSDSVPAASVPPGTVTAVGDYAVGNHDESYFAVSKRCRHLGADLSGGSISPDGCLVCPWHRSEYDVASGRMTRGPQGIFAKVPGLGTLFMTLTRVVPLRRRRVTSDGTSLTLE